MKPLNDAQTTALLRLARRPGRENGVVMRGLVRRGLVRAEQMTGTCRGPYIQPWVLWHATEEGARLAEEILAQRRAAELASRAAEGTVKVSRWALRILGEEARRDIESMGDVRQDPWAEARLERLRDLVAAVDVALSQEGNADVPATAD